MRARTAVPTLLVVLGGLLTPVVTAPAATATDCRPVSGSMKGAKIGGQLCKERGGFRVKGWVKDTAADKHAAAYRIQYVREDNPYPGDQTYTQFVDSTKDMPSGSTKKINAAFQGVVHDLVAQPCIRNFNDKKCATRWF